MGSFLTKQSLSFTLYLVQVRLLLTFPLLPQSYLLGRIVSKVFYRRQNLSTQVKSLDSRPEMDRGYCWQYMKRLYRRQKDLTWIQ